MRSPPNLNMSQKWLWTLHAGEQRSARWSQTCRTILLTHIKGPSCRNAPASAHKKHHLDIKATPKTNHTTQEQLSKSIVVAPRVQKKEASAGAGPTSSVRPTSSDRESSQAGALRDYFLQLGLDDEELVALMGAHTVGRWTSLLGVPDECMAKAEESAETSGEGLITATFLGVRQDPRSTCFSRCGKRGTLQCILDGSFEKWLDTPRPSECFISDQFLHTLAIQEQ